MRKPDDRVVPHPFGRPLVSRREALTVVSVAAVGCVVGPRLRGENAPGSSAATLRYLERLKRLDGGYAWEDQDRSHLTSTFAVIGSYKVLGLEAPDQSHLETFIRENHPSQIKKLEQERRVFEYQQIQALAWLGADTSSFHEKIRTWTRPLAYLKQYEQHGYPVFQSELGAFSARALLGLPFDDLSPAFTEYLDSRRRPNGSFNNTPAADGGDGHVLNTWWGLQALHTLGRTKEDAQPLIEWLLGCQLPNGGFTWQPNAPFAGVDGVDYTWAAVRALKILGAEPSNRNGCMEYLHSLADADGGFGDRPGWNSNPMATYHALDALSALGALESPSARRTSIVRPETVLPDGLKVFSIQLEAHGRGSPAEAVDLARSLRIHLWGAKNAQPEWIARAQAIAHEQKAPVTFFVSNEEYGTWVDVPGLGTYSHSSDIVAPLGADIGASLANLGVVTWPEFRERRLAPLTKAGGRLLWQFGENEELVRLYLDDSVERDGYAAISTFHFGNPDFTNSEPFLHRWRGQIPYVTLQDAHGEEPWWFADMTTGFRTVFLATEPTWDGWLNALKQNWVAAIRHDALSGHKTWIHSGSSAVLEFVHAHELEWRWWDNPQIQRPLVSIVLVKPTDHLEVARPDNGVTLRVRCAWQNTPQGLPKTPITELVKLTIDGREQSPRLVTKKRSNGAGLTDQYYELALSFLPKGKHTVTAFVRTIETKSEWNRTLEFEIQGP